MHLFTRTFKGYIAGLINHALEDEGAGELRVFAQSMPPGAVYQIFNGVRDFLDSKTARVRCEMRVAKGLHDHWRESGAPPGEIDRLLQQGWIDTDDRLTHYRNLTAEADTDLLLVMLVGIDHATDRGGLADFYTLTDEALFRDCMGASYQGWVDYSLNQAGLADATGAGGRDFDQFLRQLFQMRPRNLMALSEFLVDVLLPQGASCDSASDFLGLAFENLPFWGIPPLFSPADPVRRIDLLPIAAKIFDRELFREKRERIRALERIAQAESELAVAPQTRSGVIYQDVQDFTNTVSEFIERGSRQVQERLLQTDFYVVTQILQRKPKAKLKKVRDQTLRGPSLEVFLRAVFDTLHDFVAGCGRRSAADQIQRIEVSIESFQFDGTEDDQDHDLGGAQEVFQGLVGGLDKFLAEFKIPLSTESEDGSDSREIPIVFLFGSAGRGLTIESKRLKESRLRFRVEAVAETGDLTVKRSFVWVLAPHHEERVRLTSARLIENELRNDPSMRLPVVHVGSALDELYFALDAGEAHRMFTSALSTASYSDVLDGLPVGDLDSDIEAALAELSAAYRNFVRELATKGYFAALDKPLRDLVRTYKSAVDLALRRDEEKQAYGDDLLRRLYQAFLCVPNDISSTSAYIPVALATGITPAIAETVQAREVFLRDGFLQVGQSLVEDGHRSGRAKFDRLLGLVELRRPLYGLVFDSSRRLTTNLRSFGLLHRLGERPVAAPTLAAQAEMRAEDVSDGGSLSEYRRASPESRVITQTLVDYREVHPYASDRLAVMAANVEDLRPLIAGIEAFLQQELGRQDPAITVPYMMSVRIIGRGPSPTAAQEVLRRWQESWSDEGGRQLRPCRLTLAYLPAHSREEVLTFLAAVDEPHDLGFLFDFLNDQTGGDSIVPVEEFTHDWGPGNIGKFPISEHPRPVRPTDPHLRQGQVSNRRFQLAARHAEISARLKNPDHPSRDHLIFNQVEYGDLERAMMRCMHSLARWVACVDRFVDKALILDADGESSEQRKLVGFTSGVGAYGEFNLTLSTETSTAGELLQGTARQLGLIFRGWSDEDCQGAAQCLVTEAQAITGLSLVRALGNEGVMRNVIGYAIANRIYLGPSNAIMCAAIPLDSFPHWFRGAEHGYVPDLLLLEAHLDGDHFTVEATVVECKVGQRSPTHVEEAVTQAAVGVEHLSTLFLPNSVRDRASDFDRRYWWAQLHRALVVRNLHPIESSKERAVDRALEQLAEGSFDVYWRAVAATFWTDDPDQTPSLRPARTVGPLLGTGDVPLNVYHASVGSRATLTALRGGEPQLRDQLWPDQAVRIVREDRADEVQLQEATSRTSPSELGEGWSRPEQESPVAAGAEHQVSVAEAPVTQPENPEPGISKVTAGAEIEPLEESERVSPMNLTSSMPERILLGYELTKHGGGVAAPVYWEYDHSQLPNRHLMVFGNSGQGKTYAIQAVLLEMAKAGQSSLVIDYTDGFLPGQLEPELSETVNPETFALAAGRKLPLDPFRLQSSEIEGIGRFQETPFDVAKRVVTIFTAVYTSLGEQQQATLVSKIEHGVQSGDLSLQALYDQLRDDGEDLLANKLMPLARTEPFTSVDEEAWSALFEGASSYINILQLTRIPKEVQRLIIEFLLWDLWDYLRRTGNKNRPRLVVLDEVQNLDHRSGSPLEKYLREGRKFGASMILATQTMSNFNREERDRLFQVAHMLLFKPADTELKSFANVLKDRTPGSTMDEWTQLLSSLQKGECLSVGFERGPDGRLRQQIRHVAISPLLERIGDTP
ncbi:ATP-binding protein [Thioalkalivibrio sp. ALJ1]|uniref:ATP-binding protein n=1 Tax=Thioalkalivibrio sp. ALJ1 TaxID=1158144 RepID=UPI00056F8BCD|nr:DUF87 domain-containing protein [Thioalkalivibrio sp. ALJ1]